MMWYPKSSKEVWHTEERYEVEGYYRPRSAFHEAAAAGDLEKAEQLLQTNFAAHVTSYDSNGGILAQKTYLNALDADSNTPLSLAVRGRLTEMAEFLILRGADVNARSGVDVNVRNGDRSRWVGTPPLHQAAYVGDVEMVELLFSHGADANILDSSGCTPLHVVAEARFGSHPATPAGRVKIAELLLSHGADVDARQTCEADVNWGDAIGRTPLHLAVHASRTEMAKFLVSRGADVNAANSAGRTPLHEAGVVEIAELLMSHGADVNAADSAGETPLHWVAQTSRVELAEVLILKGAEVNACGSNGRTPLHRAASGGSLPMAELLISQGAEVDAQETGGGDSSDQGKPGWMPLHWAVSHDDIGMVELLIGADTAQPAAATVLHLAMRRGDAEINEEILRTLLRAGMDVNGRDDQGATPLHWAAMQSSVAHVKLLLAAGAAVDARDQKGRTSLDWLAVSARSHWPPSEDKRQQLSRLLSQAARRGG